MLTNFGLRFFGWIAAQAALAHDPAAAIRFTGHVSASGVAR